MICMIYSAIAHVAGWEPVYSAWSVGHVSWVGSVLRSYTDPVQNILTAGYYLLIDYLL